MIRFHCRACGQKFRVPDNRAGQKGICPNCRNFVLVPKVDVVKPVTATAEANTQEVVAKDSDLDPSLFDAPQKSVVQKPPSQPNISEKVSNAALVGVELEPAYERKLPWVIDIFLYPANLTGLVNLIILIGAEQLIEFMEKRDIWGSGIIQVIVAFYALWYFSECVRDSAEGGLRTPEILDIPRIIDLCRQMGSFVGCLIVFFVPFIAYVSLVKKAGIVFWLLLTYGVFFFPMALLAVIVLDSAVGLNPRLLLSSISNTFFQYCGLVFLFITSIFLLSLLTKEENISQLMAFILCCVRVYLLFVAAHLLGRFYWRNRDKLTWADKLRM